jgi:cobalamin biosynthesis protein CobT
VSSTALLPVIPENVRIHPLTAALLTTAAFLDLADDEQLPPQVAQPVLERVGLYVQRLNDDAADRLAADLTRLAEYAEQAGWPAEARQFVEQFMAYCGFVPDDEESDEDQPGGDDEDQPDEESDEDQPGGDDEESDEDGPPTQPRGKH